MMLILSLFWLLLGILIGALANAARLRALPYPQAGFQSPRQGATRVPSLTCPPDRAPCLGDRYPHTTPVPTGQIGSLQKDLALGRGWLVMLAVGALAAFLGGWLGALLLGKYVATAVALWVAVLGVVVMPWLVAWV